MDKKTLNVLGFIGILGWTLLVFFVGRWSKPCISNCDACDSCCKEPEKVDCHEVFQEYCDEVHELCPDEVNEYCEANKEECEVCECEPQVVCGQCNCNCATTTTTTTVRRFLSGQQTQEEQELMDAGLCHLEKDWLVINGRTTGQHTWYNVC